MRIRPAFVTSAGAFIALAAIVVVVSASTPQDAQPGLIILLWSAVFLSAWGISMTLVLVARQSMAQAVWAGLPPALAVPGMLLAWQQGTLSRQLLAWTILATLSVSVIIWWRLRRTSEHA